MSIVSDNRFFMLNNRHNIGKNSEDKVESKDKVGRIYLSSK